MGHLKQALIKQTEKANHILHLADIAHKQSKILCCCKRCGLQKTYHGENLSKHFSSKLSIYEIGPKIRCKSCGTKNIASKAI